jgi:hypothetical protein
MINGKHRKKVQDKKSKALAIKKDMRDRAKKTEVARARKKTTEAAPW